MSLSAFEFGSLMGKQAFMVGGTLGALGGLATSRKGRRGEAIGRGALIGGATETGMYPGALLGALGGTALGGLAGHMLGNPDAGMIGGAGLGAGLGALGGGVMGNVGARGLLDDGKKKPKKEENDHDADEDEKEASMQQLGGALQRALPAAAVGAVGGGVMGATAKKNKLRKILAGIAAGGLGGAGYSAAYDGSGAAVRMLTGRGGPMAPAGVAVPGVLGLAIGRQIARPDDDED